MTLPDEEGGSEGQADSVSDIEKAWDELEKGSEPEKVESEPSDEGEQPRDEMGRFKAKDEGEKPTETEEAPNEEEQEPSQYEPVSAPEHWSQEEKDKFNALSDDAKAAFLDFRKSIESGYNKKFEEVANERKTFESYQGIREVLEPYQQQIAMAGLTPATYIGRLIAIGNALQTNPEQTIRQLAQMHNVNLGNPAEGAEQDEYTELGGFNPNALKQEILTAVQQTLQQTQAQSATQTFTQEWAGFQNAKDANGSPVYPSAEKLKVRMGAELQVNPQQPGETIRDALTRAYEAVKWTDPEIRKSILEAQAKSEAAERQRKADIEKAKKSGDKAPVKGKTATNADRETPAESWKSELERNYDQLSA